MTAERQSRKMSIAAIGFGVFGAAFVLCVFCLSDDWFRRVHALTIGAINIGAAIYLRGRRQPKGQQSPNQASEVTARKLAEPQR
jgi:hypothetical protein